jgi:molybdenum-dependent DNA-binding transcriptional regulator ModE
MASPDIRFPSIEGLRAFEAAARLGSFERAAEELNVTASAIGKRIAALEDLLGTPLFTRGPKALSLTATGKEYLAQVGAALGLLAAVPLHRRTAQRVDRHHHHRRPARAGAKSACRACSTTTPIPAAGPKAPTAPTRATSRRSSCASAWR